MIPPSSLARLVLGYLEEEGLHRTAVTFQQECNDAQKDPFTQYSSLKTILEEYVEIKKTASNPDSDPGKVISSLWKKLDVIVSQLKYHTLPENKIPRVQHRTCRPRAFRNLKIAKPVPSQPNWTTLNNSQGRREFISNGNEHDIDSPKVLPSIDLTLSPSTRNNPEFIVSDTSLDQHQPGNKRTKLSVDSSGHNVPTSQLKLSCSREHQMLQLQNSQTSTFPNDLRQDCFSSNQRSSLLTTAQKSGSDALVCTCSDNHNSPVDASTINMDCTVEVVEERCTSPIMRTCNDDGMQEISSDKGQHGVRSENDKMEILSKSPKRKGQPPKKRNFSNPSPTKLVPVNPEPNASLENTFDLQQLLDGGNVDIDATMPLLLDTFLSTPLLQEKLAENINKVVGSTKQNETAPEVVSESSPLPPCEVEDAAAKQHDEPQVPVEDILNLMEADPAFDALFNLLSTDQVKTASPAKVSQAVPISSYSEPLSTASVTSVACSSAEPVSTCTTTSTIPSTSSDNLSATSVVTESLLLLASSPSKGPLISTSTASSLDNLHPISPKEVTPEFAQKHYKDDQALDSHVDGGSVHALGGPGYVRSLQFQDQQPVIPVRKPKKSKPSKQKRDASKTTINKTGKRRSRKLNDFDKNSKMSETLQGSSAMNTPCADGGEPETLSTIDVSAVKLLQSFTSLHSNADGSNGNKKDMGGKKSQGSSMVQLLQDAAISQQVQGVSTVNQKQIGALQSSSKKKSIPGCLLQSSLTPTSSSSLSSLNGSKSMDQLNPSQQCIHQKLVSPTPLVGGRPLLPRPSIQTVAYRLPLQAPPQSIPVLSSLASLSSASSTSLASSSPLYSLLSLPPKQLPQQQPLRQSSTYLHTRPYAQQSSLTQLAHSQTTPTQSSSSSSSHAKQSLIPISSYSQPPPPLSYITQSPSSSSSHAKQSLPISSHPQPPPPSSSYITQSQSPSSSSHAKQSLPISSYSQPPPPSSSYIIPQSSSSSSASKSVNQPDYFSQVHHSHPNSSNLTTTMQQSTNNHRPSMNIQATESIQNTPIHSQRMTTLVKSPSPAAMATVEFEGQYNIPSLDSSEPSPTSQNAEECVSGFISGFQGGLSCQSNNQESCSIAIKRTLSSASLDKDNDGTVQQKDGKNRKEHVYGVKNVVKQDKRKEVGGCGSVAEERGHGQKRPAGQDLKENKPKKSKGCKKPKKSKSKSLPKDFDVDKFLSKLHYVEK